MELCVVEEIGVAADDRLSAGVAGKRYQVVVVRIAQNGVDLGRVLKDCSGFGYARDDVIDAVLCDALLKIGLAQGIGNLIQQLRTEDQLETISSQVTVEQTGRALAVRIDAARYQCVGVDYESSQPAARRLAACSRRTSRTASTASRSISSDETPRKLSRARSLASCPSWMRATPSISSRSLLAGRRSRSLSSNPVSISTVVVCGVAIASWYRP
jgi:hypothetical protein